MDLIRGGDMKNNGLHVMFIKKLKQKIRELRHMKQGEIHVLTVNANYGRYKIVVGPIKDQNHIPVERDGEIHHLFISNNDITPNPTKEEINSNLKHTVMMKDLMVHINDPSGDGYNLGLGRSGVKPRECINFAGKKGDEMVRNINLHGMLSKATYKIIQEDILKSINYSKRKTKCPLSLCHSRAGGNPEKSEKTGSLPSQG